LEHDKGDIMERMDILAGQRRLIAREISQTIQAKQQQFNATKDWNFNLCDLDFNVIQILLAGPQFFLVSGKNNDLIFFSHKSLRKVQEYHDVGDMVCMASS
jgi:hypothetical protein